MPPKAVPPPPRPDPVTLDGIYRTLTSPTSTLDEKAYHLVALGTVAFHPSVKLFLYEDPQSSRQDGDASDGRRNDLRREAVLKSIAFFLAQRNNAVCEECRWETVSLLGELCRMENTDSASVGNNASPQSQLDAKLNEYAKQNLEFLALLPWFVPAAQALIAMAEGNDKKSSNEKGSNGSGSSSKRGGSSEAETSNGEKLSREELRQKIKEKRAIHQQNGSLEGGQQPAFGGGSAGVDEDVVIALKDILNALPTVEMVKTTTTEGTGTAANESEDKDEDGGDSAQKRNNNNGSCVKRCVWTPSALAQAHDLMFLDASTDLLHLIPAVSRCYSNTCALCRKTGDSSNGQTFLRCSSCKAVVYCSPACQRQHWALSHRQPCRAFKERCEQILAEYYSVNSVKGGRGKKGGAAPVTILEVPQEPSLFYETRRSLYDHRDSSFGNVNFYDYFMRYNVKGS